MAKRISDTGGVAQHPLPPTHLFTPSTLAVRRRRRRKLVVSSLSTGSPSRRSGITRG
ncbi:hypothetical protein [Alloprevotella rava]|uniref:hypothetical protein n=1 Tax=Alloprevotella rava TaxID=671218 RepID=UPI0012F9CC94|nr:hypothetical protein [Alloprevotella rava]